MTISHEHSSFESTNVRFVKTIKTYLISMIFSVFWIVASPVAKYIVRFLFFKPQKYKLTPQEKLMLKSAEKFEFKSGDDILAGYKWGQGPAIVFVHGWAGRGIQFHSHFNPLIDAGYSIITFDLPGHGNSAGRDSNYFKFSNAVFDLMLQHKNMEVFAIVAHSFGASAVINFLWRKLNSKELEAKTNKKIKLVFIAPALSIIDTLNRAFITYRLPLRIVNSLLRDIEKKSGHIFKKEDPKDLIQSIHSDLLIIHDTRDKVVSYEESWKASLRQTNIRLISTQGLGHIRILRDKEIANEIHAYIGPSEY